MACPVSENISIDSLAEGQLPLFLQKAIDIANESLTEDGLAVVFMEQLRDHNMLLGLQLLGSQEREPIDIIAMKALNTRNVKPENVLAEEICSKVKQHLIAKKTHGIIFSSSGSKFDTRLLPNHQIAIDKDGFFTVNGRRIAIEAEGEYREIKAHIWRSYTIIRLHKEENYILGFDEHDLVRKDREDPLVAIDVSKVLENGCYLVTRLGIFQDLGGRLSEILTNWPKP